MTIDDNNNIICLQPDTKLAPFDVDDDEPIIVIIISTSASNAAVLITAFNSIMADPHQSIPLGDIVNSSIFPSNTTTVSYLSLASPSQPLSLFQNLFLVSRDLRNSLVPRLLPL